MSDLISRNKLMREIKEAYTEEFLAEYGFDKLVESQPVAYDVEKVVSELQVEKTNAYEKLFDGGSRAIGFCKALEIVKRGGTDDRN